MRARLLRNQHVPANHRRVLHLCHAAAVLAILERA